MPAKGHTTAPVWNRVPSELKTFLDDVRQLTNDRALDDAAAIRYAIRYSPTPDTPLWEDLDTVVTAVWNDFVKELYDLYPGSGIKHRFTRENLLELLRKYAGGPMTTREQFGEYHRAFLTVAKYLIKNKRLSDDDRDRLFLTGFPPALTSLVQGRLAIKVPDHDHEDAFTLAQVKEAAEYVLGGTATVLPMSEVPAVAVKKEQMSSDVLSAIYSLVAVMQNAPQASPARSSYVQPQSVPTTTAWPPRIPWAASGANATPLSAPPPAAGPSNYAGSQGPLICHFCGKAGEYIKNCPLVAEYLRQGRAIRDSEGRIQPPDNSRLPYIPDSTIMQRLDKWRADNPTINLVAVQPGVRDGPAHLASSNLFSITDEGPADASTSDTYLANVLQTLEIADDTTDADTLAVLEAAIAKIKRKPQFDGVELPTRPRPAAHQPAATPPQKVTPPTLPTDPIPQFRFVAPVEDTIVSQHVIDRALNSTVTLTTGELMAVSPAVRKALKDLVTTRKLPLGPDAPVIISQSGVRRSAFLEEVVDEDSPVSSAPASVFSSTAITPAHTGRVPTFLCDVPGCLIQHPFPSAKRSAPLRVIYPVFNGTHRVECILDSGSQVSCMRKSVWENLGVSLSKDFRIGLESATAHTSQSIGEIQNLRVELGGITSYHQFQIMPTAAYDVLLGRPFTMHLNGVETDTDADGEDGEHSLTISDPFSSRRISIPTQERQRQAMTRVAGF